MKASHHHSHAPHNPIQVLNPSQRFRVSALTKTLIVSPGSRLFSSCTMQRIVPCKGWQDDPVFGTRILQSLIMAYCSVVGDTATDSDVAVSWTIDRELIRLSLHPSKLVSVEFRDHSWYFCKLMVTLKITLVYPKIHNKRQQSSTFGLMLHP
ncbi:hypothetical protein M758_4G223000 [Ceratodon purpureus]|uniref:Uncharacterized protein n=1 Tax=Ceratodon purpureus TaxID=3225 RepID=A0A8T0IDF0_CERPU|nr:hypothetical protein KC19_4G217600 [Ceratodon purpureus]KAG0620527.1 hypothetical protein M758_4G223000 [Ceratodon purpureus]